MWLDIKSTAQWPGHCGKGKHRHTSSEVNQNSDSRHMQVRAWTWLSEDTYWNPDLALHTCLSTQNFHWRMSHSWTNSREGQCAETRVSLRSCSANQWHTLRNMKRVHSRHMGTQTLPALKSTSLGTGDGCSEWQGACYKCSRTKTVAPSLKKKGTPSLIVRPENEYFRN